VTRFTSPRLAAYAALAAGGLVAGLALGRVEPVALAAPFALAALAGAVLGRDPQLSARFELDRQRALEGDTVEAAIELSSTTGADVLDVLVRLPEELTALGNSARTIVLRRGEQRTLELPLRCERWGAFRVGPLVVRVRDPLAFNTWEGVAGEGQSLRVYPSEETLKALVAPLETRVNSGNQVARTRGEGIEFADLREWQRGDRIRRVNWRASARRGALWVNEQHPERNTDVVLFLDTFAEAGRPGRGTHDRAVRAAATLAHAYLGRKDRVGLVGFGGTLSWLLPAMGMKQLYAIVDTLIESSVVSSFVQRDVEILPPRTLPPQALVLALTPLLDDRSASTLLDLRTRGYDLVVVEVSPLELVAQGRDRLGALAHRLWRLSRQALRWQFTEAGVPIVTWREDEPFALPLEEVRAYRHLARPA
jgi:uncharacterized protein (DUF58 family)